MVTKMISTNIFKEISNYFSYWEFLRNVFPMEAYHISSARPWKFDKNATHNGKTNTFQIEKGGKNIFGCRPGRQEMMT